MAFQIKNFISITASMVNRLRATTKRITDYSVGAVGRTILEAASQEIDELYQQMVNGLNEAIPVSVYGTFSFPALAATPASSPIRVTITSSSNPTLISAGTTFQRPDNAVAYTSTTDITIAAGDTFGDVPVTANTTGTIGNLAQGTSFTLSPVPNGFVSATNLVAFSDGADAETEAARKLRFNQYVSTLARGTLAAISYGLSTVNLTDANGNITERVKLSAIIEPYKTDNTQPVGLINCYIHNGVGSTSAELVAQAQKVIDGYYDVFGNPVPGWAAAGTHRVVIAATEQQVAVTATLTAAPGYVDSALIASAEQAISTYILGLNIGGTGQAQNFDLAQVTALVMAIPGVANWVTSAPAADVVPTTGVKLMPGTFTITGN